MNLDINTLYNENCLETMRRMPDNYLDAIVTDPPYGLQFMGKKWDYDVPSVEIWREALRVLKPGGHLLAFAGSRTYHRMAVAVEDGGFEIRDMIEWVYGSGFPKSLNIGKAVDKVQGNDRKVVAEYQTHDIRSNALLGKKGSMTVTATIVTSSFEGYGTALKPAHEPCLLARKPVDGTVANNVLKYGTGGLNIDGTRVGTEQLINKGMSSLGTMHDDNWVSDRTVSSVVAGRFPANLIHDGSDEVLELFPQTKSGKPGVKKTGNNGYAYGAESRPPGTQMTGIGDSGSAARFFYTAKASKSERGKDNIHPTVKPLALMKYLVKLVAPPGQAIVYDPFSGSGTTLIACRDLGISFIGSEISKEYCDIAQGRIARIIK